MFDDAKFDDIKYLNVELPENIKKKKWYGDFEGAARLIDLTLEQEIPDALRKKLVLEKRILKLLPLEYVYSYEEAMQLVRERIPDFTEEEFRSLEDAGRIDWIYVNGEIRYFRRFFETLLATEQSVCDRAKQTEEEDNPAKRSLLNDTMHKLKEKGSLTCHFRIRESLRIEDNSFQSGKKVRVHLPVPIDCMQVTNAKILKTVPEADYLAPANAAQRTVFFEKTLMENREFSVEYEYDNTVVYIDPKPEETEKAMAAGAANETGAANASRVPAFRPFDPASDIPGHGEPTQADIAEQAPHIVFTPYLRALEEELAGEEKNPLVLARRFYDFVTTKVKYSFMREYFAIENIPEYAALNHKADCGVQALLFITLCRIAGIPARWQSGLYTTPFSAGSHDWAQFYAAPYGWMFADCSFGGSAYRNGQEERWNFYFGNLDPYRMPANCVFQSEFDPPRKFLRNDPYDNQRGEAEYEDRPLGYDELDFDRQIVEAFLLEE